MSGDYWPATARLLTYRWHAPRQEAFTAPAIELKLIYDPDAFHEPAHLEWALDKALHQLRHALATELKGDTHADNDEEGSG